MLFCMILFVILVHATPDVFWRLPCEQPTGYGRIDPIQSPGHASQHTHVIFGSGNFGYSVTYDYLRQANCTSCAVNEDRSAYWAPALYFTSDNQTFERVQLRGGLVVYYFMNNEGNQSTTFPAGFRMVSGDSDRRTLNITVPDPPTSAWGPADMTEDALRQKAIGFNCLGSNPPEGSLTRHTLPSKAVIDSCPGGLRLELMFPSCWNGALDSADHRSHVAFPSLVHTGSCPITHQQHLPTLLYEIAWNTMDFLDTPGTFVLANGDPTGNGYHGDFISGWDSTVLQNAGNVCTDPDGVIDNCDVFTMSSSVCEFVMPDDILQEDYTGPRIGLPGGLWVS